jgi:DNA invertase Pin-like site-specific DNA recombinase
MSKRAAILCRVSTTQQARDDRYGIPAQRSGCLSYAKKNSLAVDDSAFYIDAISGASETREAFYRLLSEAERYEAVVIYNTARVGRDEEISHKFLRLLWEAGLEVHSVERGGVVERGFITSAEILMAAEGRRTILRTTLNARIQMAEGGKLPGGISLYGYLSVKGVAMAHPEQYPHLLRIFTLAAEGRSFNEIAEALHRSGAPPARPTRKEQYTEDGELKTRTVETRWQPGTVSRIIRNRSYLGTVTWGRYRLQIPQLIPTDLWRRAQRHRVGAPPSLGWALVGHLRCGRCGTRMSGHRASQPSGRELQRYRCNASGGVGRLKCGAVLSRRKSEARVEAEVRRVFSDPAEVRALLEQPEPDDHETLEQLAELEARSREAFSLWRAGHITGDELGMIRSDLTTQRAALQGARESLSYPVEEYMAAAEGLPLREALELFGLVATITRDDLSLAIERS